MVMHQTEVVLTFAHFITSYYGRVGHLCVGSCHVVTASHIELCLALIHVIF